MLLKHCLVRADVIVDWGTQVTPAVGAARLHDALDCFDRSQ